MSSSDRPLAAVDLGTNTVRLLVGRVYSGRWEILREERRITRLGEGLVRTGFLGEAPMARTLEALRAFRKTCDALGARDVAVGATSAVREARNGQAFVERIFEETGWSVRILSGEEEARLSLWGVIWDFPEPAPLWLVDIGGGSTEFVWTGPAQEGHWERAIRFQMSLPLGVVHLSETWLHRDPPTLVEQEALIRAIQDTLGPLVASLSERGLLEAVSGSMLVGTAGTVTTLAALHLGLSVYDRDAVHHTRLPRKAVASWWSRLVSLPRKGRLALPGMEPGREDLILPGVRIVLQVMDRFGFPEMWVSDGGLREGILLALALGKWPALT